MIFLLFISFIIALRLGELLLAKRNAKWLLQNNAVEYGKEHYPVMVAMHTLFFVSLLVEYYYVTSGAYSVFYMVFYGMVLLLKIWIIASLGKFWNTRIYHIAGFPLVKKGLYKYVKHPNYLIVIAEIAIIPLAFHLYYTALIFSILNVAMLYVRISVENKALQV